MADDEGFGVFGNSPGCRVFRPGALLLLSGGFLNGGDERTQVLGVSRGGRYVAIYRDLHDIENLRVKYIPHRFLGRQLGVGSSASREDAEKELERIRERLNG